MTLLETFSKYTLTSGQNSLIDELNKFLSDNSTCFLLKGYAGTGKTFIMKYFIENIITQTKIQNGSQVDIKIKKGSR